MADLYSYIPVHAVEQVKIYLSNWNVDIKVVSKRKSKHGDYRKTLSGSYQITINKSSNPYRFLITLIHELSHHVAFHGVDTITRINDPLARYISSHN
jgi:Zn-dependent peptidase ImmA (M78 family)